MSKLERNNFDYLKKFALISSFEREGIKMWRAYFVIWVIKSVKKTELRLYAGPGKTRKEAVENTWQKLVLCIKKGKIKVMKDKFQRFDDKKSYEKIPFISLAPAVKIPKEYGEHLEFYYK